MTASTLQKGQAGLPTRHSTSSYWHKDPSSVLLGHRTTPTLPAEADVVVIGSGITGTFVARELVGGGRDVVMLESREACWGATGRDPRADWPIGAHTRLVNVQNGGHCRPMLYLRKPHIAQFELDTYDMLRELVSRHAIPCGWKTVGGVQTFVSQATLDLARERVAQLEASHPELARQLRLVTDRSKLEDLRLGTGAVGAVVQECAASCWPYKLVSWVLETLLGEKEEEASSGKGKFNLQTGTSALHLQRGADVWIVHTDRGQIAARDVVLATNAYTSHLLPKFSGLITPVRGQVAALVNPDDAAPIAPLDNSYVWQVREDGDPAESDDYLIYRDSGEFILGGERNTTIEAGWATSDDDVVDPVVSRRLHAGLHKVLTGVPAEMKSSHEWTGIMGYSADENPWVGRVPEGLGGGDSGLWVTAGYTGHGMPVAARCGIAVAEMVLGKSGHGTVNLPPEWVISEERASAVKSMALPETFEDELRLVVQEFRKD